MPPCVGFYIDPAITDACLHLSAVECEPRSGARGVPISCGAFLSPRHSRAAFPVGHASAIRQNMSWTPASAQSLQIADLLSQPLSSSSIDNQQRVSVEKVFFFALASEFWPMRKKAGLGIRN